MTNINSTKQKQLPLPKCYCFYNGSKDQPERSVLKLTDAFPVKESDIEVCVTILNINYGHNQEIMDGCQSLKEYAMLTDEVRKEQQEGKSIDAAVAKAIDALPPDSVLREYLLANKAEVTRMCITEYDEEKTMRLMREEEHEEGREEGRKEGDLERYQKDLQTLANNLQKSNPSLSDEDALKQAESLLKP